MQLYFHDNKNEIDHREDHHSGVSVSTSDLSALNIIALHTDDLHELEKIAKDREYKNRDIININKESFGGEEAYKAKLDAFYTEHLHEDEEIRYILDGEGFFDVRDNNDKWIRSKLQKGDLLILPAGIYHRFTLTTKNYVKALRLFKDEPKWLAINRDTNSEQNDHRLDYIQSIRA